MTATQAKRIRRNLEQSAALTAAADDAARDGHADHSLRELTARAADDAQSALRNLDAWDTRMRQNADAIAREIGT